MIGSSGTYSMVLSLDGTAITVGSDRDVCWPEDVSEMVVMTGGLQFEEELVVDEIIRTTDSCSDSEELTDSVLLAISGAIDDVEDTETGVACECTETIV